MKEKLKRISNIFETFLVLLIRVYQFTFSYLIGRECRFFPSCSEYTILAIKKYGPIKGIWLGIKRISRCHPKGGNGVDFP